MAKRKLKRTRKLSDEETESPSPVRGLFNAKNSSSSKMEVNSGEDSDICDLGETSGAAEDKPGYESYSSFLKAFNFFDDSDNGHSKSQKQSKSKGVSVNASMENDSSMNDSERRKSHEQVSQPSSSFYENELNEELEPIRLLSVPSKLTQVALLQHPASLTLHGYVKVSTWCGNIFIFGYHVKEGQNVVVFSTEGTGLKKVTTTKPKHKLDIRDLAKKLEKLTCLERDLDLESFLDDVGPYSVVVCIEKVLMPDSLMFLGLYYPNALQTRWVRSETSEKETSLKLCSAEEDYTVDIKGDFKVLSRKVNQVINNLEGAECGPRILIRGEKNMGKSTLIRYLMNSALNKVNEVYFLDTDPGQTEYTPPGVVSLLRVTKPLFGPPFAHQKRPLKMIFIGSVTPGTCPLLYKESVEQLMKYFNEKICKIGVQTERVCEIQKKALFVNTIGWTQGVGALCLQNVKQAVNPTMEIELVAAGPDVSLTGEVDENGVTIFKLPSKAPTRESGTPSYSAVEQRNFNIVAYFGLYQQPYLPLYLINSFHPVCVGWDQIALYVMGKKVPAHRLIEAIHCSVVALCRVPMSCVMKSDNPGFPMTLSDEPIAECLGFGLVRASDELNRLFYIVTPLKLDELMNVNALIKGNVMIPNEIFNKQKITGISLPFTNQSQVAKTPGLKTVPKRAFRNASTPNRTR